jgi:S1-C subfamily serine protease
MMNMHSMCCLALLVLASPAIASAPQAAPASTSATPADRAAMQREMKTLRQRMDKLAKRMGELSNKLASNAPDSHIYTYLSDPDRGRLGMVIQPRPNAHGLDVLAVTPGGPADQAGLNAGDIIVGIDGDNKQGNAKMSSRLTNLEKGTTLTLAVKRKLDGTRRSIKVTAAHHDIPAWWAMTLASAQSAADAARALTPDIASQLAKAMSAVKATPGMRKLLANDHRVFWIRPTPWADLNLVALNPDLGQYFGTTHGALVLATHSRYPGLEAGDVITAVNGKPVDRPTDVMRALRGQLPGMTVTLTVRRHDKPKSIRLKVPKATATHIGAATSSAASGF